MRVSVLRFPLIGGILLMLVLGGWAALQRAGWPLPTLRPALVSIHGPLMIGGVFGALIALERAVALSALLKAPLHWSFAAPTAAALGGLLLIGGGVTPAAQIALTIGSALLIGVYAITATQRHYWSLPTVMLCAGAVLWTIGNLAWLAGQPVYAVVHAWMAFIVLTIVGERLELSRVLRLTRRAETALIGAVLIYSGGTLLALADLGWGVRVSGTGAVLLALWLLRCDIAGRRLRHGGLTGYIAVCLFTGYLWLLIGGALALYHGAVYAGYAYDAVLHAIVGGFIFAMVFGHAPLIVPALTSRAVPFTRAFYLPLIVLHVSTVLRQLSNAGASFDGRMAAGALNAAAIGLFFLLIVRQLRSTDAPPPDV